MRLLIVKCAVVLCLVGGGLGLLRYANKPPTKNAFVAANRGNYVLAAELLQIAADDGNLSANTTLANYYKLGLGVPKDIHKAVTLYVVSAQGGDLSGMINLGLMYRDGQGIEKNPELAYAWLNLAGQSRNSVALLYMSEMLANNQLTFNTVSVIKKKYPTLASMPQPIAAGE